jgi:hypothetical protein
MLTNQLSHINYQSPCDLVKSTISPQGFNIKYPFLDKKKHAIHIKSPFSDVSMIFMEFSMFFGEKSPISMDFLSKSPQKVHRSQRDIHLRGDECLSREVDP